MKLFPHLLLSGLLAAVLAPAGEKPAAPGKSTCHLFNPTPREAMRELSTDRPDQTESPFTVDAGHVQVEMDLATFTYDRYNSLRADVRAGKRWKLGESAWWGVNAEVLNATSPSEVVRLDCGQRCAQRVAGPVILPSLGVEAGF